MVTAMYGDPGDGLRIRLLGGFHIASSTRSTDDAEWRLPKVKMLIKKLYAQRIP
jgi:hypothetical protein